MDRQCNEEFFSEGTLAGLQWMHFAHCCRTCPAEEYAQLWRIAQLEALV